MFDSDTSIEKIFERLRPILADRGRIEPTRITLASRLVENLNIDSMELIEVCYQVENEFNFDSEELDDYFIGEDSQEIITVEHLVMVIKELLENCPYCHQIVRIDQAIPVKDYYDNRLAYVHPECETPTRQLERQKIREETIRQQREREEKLQLENEKIKLREIKKKLRERKQKCQTVFKVLFVGISFYAILLYTLGFNFFILILILILMFVAGVIFI